MNDDFIRKLDDMKVYTEADYKLMYNQWLKGDLVLPQEYVNMLFSKLYNKST